MITLSQAASDKIKEMMSDEGMEGLFLRLGVRPGGCTGFSYAMGLDDEKQDTDVEINDLEVKVVVDAESAPFLKGVEIDYQDAGMGGGFTINNPNAVASCGCGSSFRTATEAGKPDTEC